MELTFEKHPQITEILPVDSLQQRTSLKTIKRALLFGFAEGCFI